MLTLPGGGNMKADALSTKDREKYERNEKKYT